MTARVLVVDDLAPNVRLLEARLVAEYYDVVTAASGAEALRRAIETRPDIILLDVMMPGMDGFECCRRLKDDRRTEDIPVIMVTALSEIEDRVRGLEAGADDFLTKPIHDLALHARIRSLLRLKRLIDEWRGRRATAAALDIELGPGTASSDPVGGALILAIGADDGRMARIREALDADGDIVDIEPDPAAALARLAARPHDLAIVGLDAEAGDPLRHCARIRGQAETRHLPILALIESGDPRRLARALDLGVNDYVLPPLDRNELRARVRIQVRRGRYQARLRDALLRSVAAGVTDSLTGLHNRRYLERHLIGLAANAGRNGKPLALLAIDIDHFKAINDALGHVAGDAVLRGIAVRLQDNLRGFDSLARWGGEEFLVAMPDTDTDIAMAVAERLRGVVAATPLDTGAGRTWSVSVSIGVATLSGSGDSVDALIARADAGLYAAKRAGRDRVHNGNDILPALAS